MDRKSKRELDEKQTKIVVSLYRHLFWTENLKKQFESVLARDRAELERRLQAKQIVFDPKLLESEMYLSMWLGCLYSVIEGWSNLKIDEPRIRHLLEGGYKKKLHGFRDAVFHPVGYDDGRFHALVVESQKSLDEAGELTEEFKVDFESILMFPTEEQSHEG